jgi:hypothetical protein
VFDIDFSQTGGTGVGFNGFGNIYVTGGNANQISPGDALTASVSLTSTTFDGGNLSNLSIGFTSVNMGGYSNTRCVIGYRHDRRHDCDKDYSSGHQLRVRQLCQYQMTIQDVATICRDCWHQSPRI